MEAVKEKSNEEDIEEEDQEDDGEEDEENEGDDGEHEDRDSNEAEAETRITSRTDLDDNSELQSPDQPLSGSSPQSRSPSSPTTKMSRLDLNGVKRIVSSDLTKHRTSQQRKYHSKRGTHRAGRPHGSKAKQDTRVKLDHSGVWG